MTIVSLNDWHAEPNLVGAVSIGYTAGPPDTITTYWGARPAGTSHVLALPTTSIDPQSLAVWLRERMPSAVAIATETDPLIAADLRVNLSITLRLALELGDVRRFLPAALALSITPWDGALSASAYAAKVFAERGERVSVAGVQREITKAAPKGKP